MVWTESKTLQIIELYRYHEILWDPKHPQYYNKIKKASAWEDISSKMGEPPEECKKKMVTVLSSMRRQKMMIRKSLKVANDPEDVYQPTWFAYNSLHFLEKDKLGNFLDETPIPIKRIRLSNEDHSDSHDPIDDDTMQDFAKLPSSDHSDTETNEITINQLPVPMIQPKTEPVYAECAAPFTKNAATSRLLGVSCATSTSTRGALIDEEECRSFGDYIVSKLKTYKRTSRSAVQHAISNIIFKADIGQFEQEYNPDTPEKYY